MENKKILVTGATNEIGTAISLAISKHGGEIILLDDNKKKLIRTAEKIYSQTKQDPLAIEFATTNADQNSLDTLSTAIQKEYSLIDGIIHCAAIYIPLTPFVNSKLEHWQKILSQQVLWPIALTHSLLPAIKEAKSSSIVFVTQNSGRNAKGYWGGLASCCASIESLSKTLAIELADEGIKVNTVDPGNVKTAIRKQHFPAETPDYLRDSDDEQIMNTLLHLLSDQNQHTGQSIVIPNLDNNAKKQ